MNAASATSATGHPVHPDRLFLGSCLALISTSVAFGVVSSIMGELKTAFTLSNTAAGWIGGATIWGFTLSIFALGPLVDVLGMRRLLRFSLLCHLVGPLLMIFAQNFWMLFAGGLILSLGNGTIEAVCNPLVATLYPDRKTQKLNQFHVWFPGGIVIGGVLSFAIGGVMADGGAIAPWQLKLALILIPSVIYGVLFTGQAFPSTERTQQGISFEQMLKETFSRPLFWLLFVCMAMTASLELGPGRWMGEAMDDAMTKILGIGGAGILVLAYGNGIMAVLRFFAGPVVRALTPVGLLACSAALAGIGLFSMTYATAAGFVILSATVFYVGVCYFWPTMLGVAAERIPKGGETVLAMLGGWGMAVVGLVTVPAMGAISDHYIHSHLPEQETVQVLRTAQAAPGDSDDWVLIGEALTQFDTEAALPFETTANALRVIIKDMEDTPLGEQAQAILGPADNAGNLAAFRWVSALAVLLLIAFVGLLLTDRKNGFKHPTGAGAH